MVLSEGGVDAGAVDAGAVDGASSSSFRTLADRGPPAVPLLLETSALTSDPSIAVVTMSSLETQSAVGGVRSSEPDSAMIG